MPNDEEKKLTRRQFIAAGAGLIVVAGTAGFAGRRIRATQLVWQIDPALCIHCGQCAAFCVLNPSAVKCVHAFELCGYCEPCFGFFLDGSDTQRSGAENQLCPMGALLRKHVHAQFHEYIIDEDKCIGCARCVKGCNAYGNGSLYLQVRHDRCLNCSQCAIAEACPSGAFVRVPADRPYIWLQVSGPGGKSG